MLLSHAHKTPAVAAVGVKAAAAAAAAAYQRQPVKTLETVTKWHAK
jgi:hypothetical protein